jgi:hypothetical protein
MELLLVEMQIMAQQIQAVVEVERELVGLLEVLAVQV